MKFVFYGFGGACGFDAVTFTIQGKYDQAGNEIVLLWWCVASLLVYWIIKKWRRS